MRKRLFAFGQVCVLAVLWGASNASAETRYVRAGESLQAALDAAQPGDVLLLESGATFVGNFVLPVKDGSTYITVSTDPAGLVLPGPNQRISPAHAASLAKLRSPNSTSVLQTAPGAHHWRLQLLEFEAIPNGYGDIIRLGDGNQTSLAAVPYELILDRLYIHGDPLRGQKRGISLQSASTRIVNSYISDIKAVGMDTQAICGWNGPGPFVIENNYLEGAGENVMFGGADPAIVNLVPSDITFRLNHVYKPTIWRQAIVATPGGVVSSIEAGGVLTTGSYGYRVAARMPAGMGNLAISAASAEQVVAIDGTGAVGLTWNAVPNATEYRVYRRSGTSWVFWTVTSTAFTDTGGAGTAGAPPSAGTLWSVKNLFEVKNARRVLLEGNVFENNWLASQTGYAILLKSWNEGGNAPWSTAQDITFTRNIVRNVASAFNILGSSYTYPSTLARNIAITGNLVYGVDSSVWGGDGRFVMIGSGPENVTVDHNTAIHTGSVVQVGSGASMGFRYTNNLSRHNTYGFKGDGASVGNGTIATYFPDGVVTRNVLAGGNASAYPAGNEFPTVADFYANFADDQYHLRSDSAYRNAGTDGADLGADVDAVLALTDRALSGNASTNQAPTASAGGPYSGPTLSAIAVDGSGSIDPDGTIASYTWNWSDGTPDTAGAVATHEFARAGTYNATLTVTDDQGAVSTATATVTVLNRAPSVDAGGPYSAQPGQAITVTATASDLDGQVTEYRWSWGDGSPDTSSSGATASHAYVAAGSYTLTVAVTDDQGAVSSAAAPVTVLNRAPSVDAGGPYSGLVGQAITMTATASDADGQVTGYRWSWGDGSPDTSVTGVSASHAYGAAGLYRVTVTVTDDQGATATDVADVSVAAPVPSIPPDILLLPAELPASSVRGNWFREPDASAAGDAKLSSLDNKLSFTNAPLATPQHYFDVTFDAAANTSYRLWLRLAAKDNSKWNDSVWVQFSDAVDAAGAPLYPIGTTRGLVVNLATDASASSLKGWGWQNTAYWLQQTTLVRFAKSGTHTLRMQLREDGVQIDQILLSASTYLNVPPGPAAQDTNLLAKPLTDIVVYAADISAANTWWQPVGDVSAAAGTRLSSPDAGWAALDAPLAAPERYVDVTVQAQANVDYRVWLRLKSANNSKYNDAVWVQFSDASADRQSRYRIGTTDGLLVNLATTSLATSLNGWGWQNGAYWKSATEQPSIVRFPTCGSQTIRIQVREDGVSVDQIVLSPERYLNSAPGPAGGDATIVPKP